MTDELDAEQRLSLDRFTDRANVVVGVDGSEAGQRALHYAAGVARRTGARLIVLHVRRNFVTYDGMGPQGLIDDGALDAESREEVDATVRECGLTSAYVEMASTGSIAPVIAHVAAQVRADAVVVGASRHPLHRVAGSVGAQLIKTCTCPTTVVP